jgi:hypothetical protein
MKLNCQADTRCKAMRKLNHLGKSRQIGNREEKPAAYGDICSTTVWSFRLCLFIDSLRTWLQLIREFVIGTEPVQTQQKWAENSRVANRHTDESEEQNGRRKRAHIVLKLNRKPEGIFLNLFPILLCFFFLSAL